MLMLQIQNKNMHKTQNYKESRHLKNLSVRWLRSANMIKLRIPSGWHCTSERECKNSKYSIGPLLFLIYFIAH